MSYTYDITGTAAKDKLRLIIPDRVNLGYDPPAVFQDEELATFLGIYGSIVLAAAGACEVIAMDAAKQAISVSLPTGLSFNKSQIPSYFLQRAKMFREQEMAVGVEEVDYFDYHISPQGDDESEYNE